MLSVHDKAPHNIVVKDDQGNDVSLQQYRGKWVVLYFYPRDNTPGCTVEAEGFRDLSDAFAKQNAVVLGVSKDSVDSHVRFKDKKQLPFTLLSDPEHKLMDAFGVWAQKKMAGKTYMGTLRTTFIIDPEGNIAHVWEKVTPRDHPQEVLETLKALQKGVTE